MGTESKFLTNLKKLALSTKESIDLSDFTNYTEKNIHITKEPFPHFIAENFFKPEIYDALCKEFNAVMERGLSNSKGGDFNKFHAFDIDYDGYLYVPAPTLARDNPLRLFYSLEWNMFFSKLFRQFTSFETSFVLHHHPPGDRTGFVHHDFSDKRFHERSVLLNGVIAPEIKTGAAARRRVISLLIYINNPVWQEGDGGETAIYAADKTIVIKKIPPINNTLFAFQTSPVSFHAFQANKKDRNCLVQWFHMPPELL